MGERAEGRQLQYTVAIRDLRWLSSGTYELIVERPSGYSFRSGQKVSCRLQESRGRIWHQVQREYSLAGAPEEDCLRLCIRYIPGDGLSAALARAGVGDSLEISDAYGFFIYRPGNAVFVATGTGIAPFAAHARAGVCGFTLLHGVRHIEELYYRDLLEQAAGSYVACISGGVPKGRQQECLLNGRVTEYMEDHLPRANYDFYLCGNGAMLRDAMAIVDRVFPASKIYSEMFYSSP